MLAVNSQASSTGHPIQKERAYSYSSEVPRLHTSQCDGGVQISPHGLAQREQFGDFLESFCEDDTLARRIHFEHAIRSACSVAYTRPPFPKRW